MMSSASVDEKDCQKGDAGTSSVSVLLNQEDTGSAVSEGLPVPMPPEHAGQAHQAHRQIVSLDDGESHDEVSGIVSVDLSSSACAASNTNTSRASQSESRPGLKPSANATVTKNHGDTFSSWTDDGGGAGTNAARLKVEMQPMHRMGTGAAADTNARTRTDSKNLTEPLVSPSETTAPPDIYAPVPRPAPAASAASVAATTATASSTLGQTNLTRDQRRQLFIRRTAETAKRVWDRVNPNMQICLCQTAARQIEAEEDFTQSDRSWVGTPTGAAAQNYVENAAASIDHTLAVEVYRRFLFDEDATRSKCDDEGED